MSLHKFAEQVASQGRGDDSLLVHMTPDEVRNLQQFAQANGTTLTINPVTGLPEAGLLSDLFKAVAPIALGAFLGPAGAAFGGGLMSAGMAGLTVGGITTLATGSLSRGLMAGLGAYGGAGLGESLMSAGTGAGMTEALAGSSTGNLGQAFGDVAATATDGSAGSAFNKFLTSNANPATMSASELASSGLKAAADNPLDFAKSNMGNLAYAAAPIAAGLMVPTTTKLPDPKNTGYIRQMAYNINPDTGMPDPLYGRVEMTPVKASEFGNKTFQGQRDLFYQQNPNPYELGVGSLNQPPRMAGGGIVALAGGGDVVRMAGGTPPAMLSDEALYQKTGSWEAAAAARDAQNNALNAYNWNQAQQAQNPALIQQAQANAVSTQNALAAAKDYVAAAATPTATTEQFVSGAQAKNIGLTQELQTALANSGLSAAAQYALTHSNIGPDVNKEETYGGLKGLSSNINYIRSGLQEQIGAGRLTGQKAREDALIEMNKYGINDADIFRATGKTLKELFPDTVAKKADDTGLLPPVVTPPVVTPPVVTPDPFTSVIPGGFYGNATNPGDITTNKDGTVTVHPNIPYRPPGGFSGMTEVRNAYTKGGGSLGYTAPIPKNPETYFNKMTDDSLDAYNFLMGRGKNLTQRKAETRDRPVMARYDEAVLGRKIPKLTKPGTTTTKTVTGVPGQPRTYFNEAEYLAANPDVAAEIKTGKTASGQPTRLTSAYDHYLMYGKAEGRPFTGDYAGYTTALALADAANAGGGGDSGGPGGGGGGTGPGGVGGAGGPASTTAANSADMGDVGDADLAGGGITGYAMGGGLGSLGSYSDGGRLLKGPGDGVSDSIPATIGQKQQPARLADGEFVIPARIVSELGNGSTDAGAKKLYAMMDRVQRARGKTTGKNKVAANSRADKYLPA